MMFLESFVWQFTSIWFFFFFSDALDHKFIGCPISIENAKYSRNALVFNVCFVLGPNVDTIRYEGVVKKLAGYMTSLEVIKNFLNMMLKIPLIQWQCFRQTAPLWESRVAFREANLALYFYETACRLNPGIVF